MRSITHHIDYVTFYGNGYCFYGHTFDADGNELLASWIVSTDDDCKTKKILRWEGSIPSRYLQGFIKRQRLRIVTGVIQPMRQGFVIKN